MRLHAENDDLARAEELRQIARESEPDPFRIESVHNVVHSQRRACEKASQRNLTRFLGRKSLRNHLSRRSEARDIQQALSSSLSCFMGESRARRSFCFFRDIFVSTFHFGSLFHLATCIVYTPIDRPGSSAIDTEIRARWTWVIFFLAHRCQTDFAPNFRSTPRPTPSNMSAPAQSEVPTFKLVLGKYHSLFA